MCANGDPQAGGSGDGDLHDAGIAAVESAGDVDGRHRGKNRVVITHAVRAEALSHVAVDIDGVLSHSSLEKLGAPWQRSTRSHRPKRRYMGAKGGKLGMGVASDRLGLVQ